MRNLLTLILCFPLVLFSQNCITNTNVLNADSIIYCVTNSTCHASCDGEVSIIVYGINQPYYFEWGSSGNAIANDNNRDSLCAGSFSVTITDNNGNLVDFRSNQIEEPSELGIFKTIINPTCFGYSDGIINITTLGDSPFTWSWDNGFNTEDLSTLSSGQYILTTTDSNNCSRVDSFNLIDPLEVSSQIVSDTLSCISICDASAIVLPEQGISPFTFLWSDGQTTDTAFNLCYGTHNVITTDSNGCFTTNTLFIENPDTLKLSSVIIDSSCYQICDGEIEVTITGGSSPYNIIWQLNSIIIDSNNTIQSGLCPDLYSITFTDANNCSETESIFIYERDSFNLQTTIVNDSCFNSCSGQIEVNILNQDNPPFIYNWSNGINSTNVISDLCADTFQLEIIDSRLCKDTFDFIVSEPNPITIDSSLVLNNICFNDANGSVSVNINGGTGTLTTLWSGPNNFSSNNEDIANLNNGTYTLHIEDDYSCTKDTIFTIQEPDSLFAISSIQDVSCNLYSDGAINIIIQGGTVPYLVSWNSVLSDSTYIDSLTADDYVYFIVDSNGCIYSDTVQVNEPESLTLTDSIINVLCKGYPTGSIDIEISGGTSPYTYLWSNLEVTQDLQDIPDGNYSVVVTDLNLCQISYNFIITEPQFPLTSNILGTSILCHGDATGEADLSVSGGTYPYSFQWSNSETTEDISELLSGNYTVTIIDDNGCDTTNTIEISENSEIISSYLSPVFTKCYGDSTGEINILSTTGGVPPYTYDCSNGFSSNTNTIILASAGQYTVIVSDAYNCEETLQFNVLDPPDLTSNITITNIDCYGNNNGSIDFSPIGGVSGYSFLWSNNETTEDLNNLSPGIYTVELTDSNGCVIFDTASITEPGELVLVSSIENSVCNGEPLASIDITVSGGTGILSYNWSNSETSEDLNNIIAGIYTLDIIDANNCIISENFTVTEPLAYLDVFNSVDVRCYGESTGSVDLILSGNTPPYFYSWSNGASSSSIENIEAGLYSVLVQDINNCTETFNIEVFQPEEVIIDYLVMNASCEENNDGSISTNVSGGTLPYAYLWSNGDFTSDLNNLSKGFYTLELRDANSCVYPTKTIEVGFEGYDGCIEIPSGFTPNNDGIHDEWAIYGLYNFPDVVVHIHNRWGQKVFFSEGYSVPWDGKRNGADLPIATYYYVIELKDSGKVFNGTVTIKR